MRNLKIFCVLFSIIFCAGAGALQIRTAKDNQTITAKISVNELTRIFIVGDRIQNTRGIDGKYELVKDEALGAVFIKASPFYLHRPFNLFVTTEFGRTYNFLLTPMNIPAENIEIKPLSSAKKIADKWEKNSDYITTLVHLISSMENEETPEGYAVVDLANNKTQKPAGLSMKLVSLYHGNHLEGEVWEIQNKSLNTIYFPQQHFYGQHVRAISSDDNELKHGEMTYLYRIISNDR